MRGDQLARQWRIARAIEASPGGLTVAEIGEWAETGLRMIYPDLGVLQAAGFPLYTEKIDRSNHWAFVDTYKSKVPAPFTLTELRVPLPLRGPNPWLQRHPLLHSLLSLFKTVQATLPSQALFYLNHKQLPGLLNEMEIPASPLSV